MNLFQLKVYSFQTWASYHFRYIIVLLTFGTMWVPVTINKEFSNLITSEQFKTRTKEKNLQMVLVKKPKFYSKAANW